MFLFKNKNIELYERMSYALGTIINIKAYGQNAEAAINEAIDKLNEIDDKMSAFKDYSEITKVNKNAGIASVIVSKETYFLLKEAVEYSRRLQGTFDITIRPLVNLWGIGTVKENVPSSGSINETLKLVNYKDILFNDKTFSIMLKNKNQAIDLGGIAKGYAADCVRDIFKKNGVKTAIIDLGGNIFVLGKKIDKKLWNVGIQDPLEKRGEFIGIISVQDKSIVTSGNYEKYFVKNDKIFHHILDPRTGYPSDSRIISATIISNNSIDGDGLSTGVYILGVEKALELIESIEGIDAIFITDDKKVYVTAGVRKSFELTNKEYIYINY